LSFEWDFDLCFFGVFPFFSQHHRKQHQPLKLTHGIGGGSARLSLGFLMAFFGWHLACPSCRIYYVEVQYRRIVYLQLLRPSTDARKTEETTSTISSTQT
jgi:hypothetical protein